MHSVNKNEPQVSSPANYIVHYLSLVDVLATYILGTLIYLEELNHKTKIIQIEPNSRIFKAKYLISRIWSGTLQPNWQS